MLVMMGRYINSKKRFDMERDEHLVWAKERAIKERDDHGSIQGWASFSSDMSKHCELETHAALPLGTMMLLQGLLATKKDFDKYIDGFN